MHQLDEVSSMLAKSGKIYLTTHSKIRPDGDAVGSLLGLTLMLLKNNKEVFMVVDGGIPAEFHSLPVCNLVHSSINELGEFSPDIAVILDCSTVDMAGQSGEQAFKFGVPVLIIDHHASNKLFGTVNLVEPHYSSTCELLVDLFDRIQSVISKDIAYALLLGMITDTNGLRTSSVTVETLKRVQTLMNYGANLSEIMEMYLDRKSDNVLILYGRVLSRIKVESGILYTYLSFEDLQDLNLETNSHYGMWSTPSFLE